VGRLSSEKGLETLIDAWCILGDNAPELRLIGDGPLKESFEKKAAGMRSIHFLGQVDPKGVKVHIAHAKLLILPSKCFEGFPMVLHEAFAFGTPVLVSDMDPLTSIVINNVNGLIFKTNSPSSLVSTFLNAWRSPSLLRRLSVGSRHSYDENYNMDVSYKKLIQIYEQSIKVAKCSK
jgi:glycosyltransferase involved in cell wall biosynthesis